MSAPLRYFHTLCHLRPIQVRYRAFYFLRKKWRHLSGHRYPLEREPSHIAALDFQEFMPAHTTWWPQENRFRFLNIAQAFGEKTDWNCTAHGKLWQYNLHYFDYLLQPGLHPAEGLRLMYDFVQHLPDTPAALEPYPTALRIINWVKFLAKHDPAQTQTVLDRSLYAQACILADNLEHHLLGNHLLEDGFALLFAACRYRDDRLFCLAAQVLRAELAEQILPDGGHFERSPMYHQTLLHRMLDLYNLLVNNRPPFGYLDAPAKKTRLPQPPFLNMLRTHCSAMLGWAYNMTHAEGNISRFNDSTDGIAPDSTALGTYASRLGLESVYAPCYGLSASGYFRPDTRAYTLIADAAPIGPDYQPGHAHCDTLSFEMSVGGRPFVVNTGISTYEKNERRHYERSTQAHNTVSIHDQEQSEIWSGHRVARRARPIVLEYSDLTLEATHTGYDRLGLRHLRRFKCAEAEVLITDCILPQGRQIAPPHKGCAYFHFHPDVAVVQQGSRLVCGDTVLIFSGFSYIALQPYAYAEGFNLLRPATRAVVEFDENLETQIIITS